MSVRAIIVAMLLSLAAYGCSRDGGSEPVMTRKELLDPESCRGCHPAHYREWASSMHAYASRDPVFRAMNQRGQRETGGELGSFCVDCHAPMAVRENATRDGLDMASVPEPLQGVTCYFCHNAIGVGDHFNNAIDLANDTIMRASLTAPRPTSAHGTAYSRLHDRNLGDSTLLCGSCHDVVTPKGVQLERTFAEYKASVFGTSARGFETCIGCHMDVRELSPDDDRRSGVRHEHLWAGVDVALSDFPDRAVQRAAIECALSQNARISAIQHDGFGGFTVAFETDAGHSQPSGAAQDRRLWLEFIAYASDGRVLFHSGDIADDELEEKPDGDPARDHRLMLLRDRIYDEAGQPTHMFWRAAPSRQHPDGYRSLLMPAMTEALTAHSLVARYQVGSPSDIARVTARLRMRPMGLDVLHDLVDSGDLEPSLLAEVPTFTLHGAAVEWSPEQLELRPLWPDELECPEAYVCLLDPQARGCKGD